MEYKKLLITEKRTLALEKSDAPITDERIQMAMTLNEELLNVGYAIKPDDIVKLLKSDMTSGFELIEYMMESFNKKPMYKNFPLEVMRTDEAVLRFHQLVHYMSTYGVEYFTGESVSRGWLPDSQETPKTKEDIDLVDKKPIDLIYEDEMYKKPIKDILEKKERMTIPESKMVRIACQHLNEMDLRDINIPFKENLTALFIAIVDSKAEQSEKIAALKNICQHTGDIWKCLKAYLDAKHWKISTSQKKLVVRLLESYPIADFRANLIISNKKAMDIIKMLEFLSYNKFSRNNGHKQAVANLRNGELTSWESKMKALIKDHSEETVKYIAERPGMLVRSINWLLKEGFDPKEIERELVRNAGALSMPTIVNVIGAITSDEERDETRKKATANILMNALLMKMAASDVPFRDKKVYIDYKNIIPEKSIIDTAPDGGYIRSGMTVSLPSLSEFIRLFCFWDDSRQRIDIDIHADVKMKNGILHKVGWNGAHKVENLATFSGDITHSNAAEYIDVKLSNEIDYIDFFVTSFTRVPFNKIEETICGILPVSKFGIGTNKKLYKSSNTLWQHELDNKYADVHYTRLYVEDNTLKLVCKPKQYNILQRETTENPDAMINESALTLDILMDCWLKTTNAERVEERENADIVLVIDKAEEENELSIIDNQFFLSAPLI